MILFLRPGKAPFHDAQKKTETDFVQDQNRERLKSSTACLPPPPESTQTISSIGVLDQAVCSLETGREAGAVA